MSPLRRRLDRLGRLCPPPPAAPHLYLAFVDGAGQVLGDGSAAVRPRVGRHYAELPGPVRVIVGVDPLRILGRATGEG